MNNNLDKNQGMEDLNIVAPNFIEPNDVNMNEVQEELNVNADEQAAAGILPLSLDTDFDELRDKDEST